jgi:hypothetical protein
MLKQLPAARMAEAVAVLSKCDPTVARTRAGQHTQPGGWAMDLDRLHAFTLRQLERHAQVTLTLTLTRGWAMDLDRLHAFTLRQLERHAQVTAMKKWRVV